MPKLTRVKIYENTGYVITQSLLALVIFTLIIIIFYFSFSALFESAIITFIFIAVILIIISSICINQSIKITKLTAVYNAREGDYLEIQRGKFLFEKITTVSILDIEQVRTITKETKAKNRVRKYYYSYDISLALKQSGDLIKISELYNKKQAKDVSKQIRSALGIK